MGYPYGSVKIFSCPKRIHCDSVGGEKQACGHVPPIRDGAYPTPSHNHSFHSNLIFHVQNRH